MGLFSASVLFRTTLVVVLTMFVIRSTTIIVEGIVDFVHVLADATEPELPEILTLLQRFGRVWLSCWMLLVVGMRIQQLHDSSDLITQRIGLAVFESRRWRRRRVVFLLLLFLGSATVAGGWQHFPMAWSHTVLLLQRLWRSLLPAAGPMGAWILGPDKSLAQALLHTHTFAWHAASAVAKNPSPTTWIWFQDAVALVRDILAEVPYFVSANARAISVWITYSLKTGLLELMLFCLFFTTDHILENQLFQPGPNELAGTIPSFVGMLNSIWRIFPPFRIPKESRERFGDLFWSNICLAIATVPDVAPSNDWPVWSGVIAYSFFAALVHRLCKPQWTLLRHLSALAIFLLNFVFYQYLMAPVVPLDGSCDVLCERSKVDRVDIIEDLSNRLARMATQQMMHITILVLLGWHMNTKDILSFNPLTTSHLIYAFLRIVLAPVVLLKLIFRTTANTISRITPQFLIALNKFIARPWKVDRPVSTTQRQREIRRSLSIHTGVIGVLLVLIVGAYQLHRNVGVPIDSDVLQWLNRTALFTADVNNFDTGSSRGYEIWHGMEMLLPTTGRRRSLLPVCQFVFNQPYSNVSFSTDFSSSSSSSFNHLKAHEQKCTASHKPPAEPRHPLQIQHLGIVADVVYGNAHSVPNSIDKLERLTGLRFQERLVDGHVNIWREDDVTVVAFRGTSNGGDVLTDVRIFLASFGLHFLLQCLPFLTPWRFILTDDAIASVNLFLLRNQLLGVNVLNSIIRIPGDTGEAEESDTNDLDKTVFRKAASDELFQRFIGVAQDILRYIPPKGRHRVFLVGHSLGGAISQVVAHALLNILAQEHRDQGQSEVHVVPVAFNSPGILWSQRLFGVKHPALLQRAINVNTEQDVVSSLDPAQANVQTLSCHDGPLLCHSMHRINCILWTECGDFQPSECEIFEQDNDDKTSREQPDPTRKIYLFLQLRWLVSWLIPITLLAAACVTQTLRDNERRKQMPQRRHSLRSIDTTHLKSVDIGDSYDSPF